MLAFAQPSFLRAADFDAAAAANQVGLALYRHLAPSKPDDNFVLSPYSIESALALVYAGADGETRAEMARVLHLPSDDQTVRSGFGELHSAFDAIATRTENTAKERRRDGGAVDPIEWHEANRLFGQQGYAFRDSFLNLVNDGYAAPFAPLDFKHAAENARTTINDWVANQTKHRIDEVVPDGGINARTRLVLVNAIYLKAPWQDPFEKDDTEPRPFYSAGGASRNVPTMIKTADLGYAKESNLTVVALNYLDRDLQFLILLADKGRSPEAVAAKLTADDFARWSKIGEGNKTLVALYLPRFHVESGTIPLGASLRALGMKSAFDEPAGSANFDRIAPRKPGDYLALSDVFHDTFIALNEDGTEAAAATVGVVLSTFAVAAKPPKPVEVRVDRPFLFAIQHRASGVCLFLGRVTDPR